MAARMYSGVSKSLAHIRFCFFSSVASALASDVRSPTIVMGLHPLVRGGNAAQTRSAVFEL